MLRTIGFALLWSTAIIAIIVPWMQAASAQQTKGVELDWPVLAPLRPGALANITLAGYENYSKVVVFVYKSGRFDERFQYSASGTVGRLTIELPPFERGTLVRLKADGIKLQYENHTSDDQPVSYSEREYLYDEKTLTEAARPGSGRSARTPANTKTVYVLGHPVAVHQKQTVTLFWTGFASDAFVCADFVCPKSVNHAPPRPAYAEYSFFTLNHLNPQMQLGCYATAVECNPSTYAALGEAVRSDETYALMAA